MSERFRPFAAVYVLLLRKNDIFLIRRFQTGWQDGNYGLPSGHLEGEERVADAACREVKEEIGVTIRTEEMKLVHVMHRIRLGEREYIDFFFVSEKWEGEPHNAEADKCDDAKWFSLDALPQNIVPSVQAAILRYKEGVLFSEYGWDGEV
jgi:8-oxo-dGTP diphosphatase